MKSSKSVIPSEIPADTHPVTVTLNVENLKLLTEFYAKSFLYNIIKKSKNSVTLGRDKIEILHLVERKDLPKSSDNDAGLYHFAVVFDSRSELARVLKNALELSSEYYVGSADHSVSEAFYFQDPENNGIEIYFDRPRSMWEWKNDHVNMYTKWLDEQEYIAKNLDQSDNVSESKSAKLGHIHLKVGDIKHARKFYIDTLGFNITMSDNLALFMSAGGYHHHIAVNIWQSAGSSPRKESLGLAEFELLIPESYKKEIEFRLESNNYKFENKATDKKNIIEVFDPWNNKIILKFS